MRALRIRPFSLEGLPRLPRMAVPWTCALARVRAVLPAQVTATVRGLGPLTVRPSWTSFIADADVSGEAFSLRVRDGCARLIVDTPLALRLVATVLGAPPPTTLRPLTRTERGTLAAVLVTFLEASGVAGTLRVGLDALPPLTSADVLAVDLEVRGAAGADGTSAVGGSIRIELPAAMMTATRSPSIFDASAMACTVAIELARTLVPAMELVSVEVGDSVVFDGSPPVPGDAAWPVRIRFGDSSLAGQLGPDGVLEGRGPLARNESEGSMSSDDKHETTALPALSTEAARALAAAPVEIVAEVGRLTLRGEELIGLIEGGVLPLGARRPAQVELRVGGQLWAMGELVAIDDELGVRITKLTRT
jgi:type III secretion system YscQ/HrcQ family protein